MTVNRKTMVTPRRRKKTTARVQTLRKPWGEPFDRLFRLMGDGWTPPAEVVIRVGTRTWTYVADFQMADGHAVRLTVKIDPCEKVVVDETMSVAFALRGRK